MWAVEGMQLCLKFRGLMKSINSLSDPHDRYQIKQIDAIFELDKLHQEKWVCHSTMPQAFKKLETGQAICILTM